ncbi:MAG: hypothetical protein K2X86_15580 [Cytophagaceae bacterium]|nr:hypothetical protein [Cytophagaceae bacterium]
MKRLLTLFAFSISFLNLNAQQEFSVFTAAGRGTATTFVTDYHTTGINPANLGFKRTYENKHVTFGLMEFGISAYSGALEKSEFRQSITDFGSSNFTYEQKRNAANQFAGQNLAVNFDLNWFGISYQHDKIGGFALNIRESARWFSNFNQNMSDIMFLGWKAPYFEQLALANGDTVANTPSNYAYADAQGIVAGFTTNPQLFSQLFEGSQISMMAYREYALSYGKEFKLSETFAIAGGLGLKYIQGYGIMQIQVEDGKLTSYGAFSPAFDINFGAAANNNPSRMDGSGLKSVGKGFGADIGLNLYYKEKIKLGVAVTNLGSITWDGNAYTAKDTLLVDMSSGGFDGYNMFSEAEKITGEDGVFKWQGEKSIKTKLPTMVRWGVSHQFEDKAEVGFDMIIPVNNQPGSLQKAYWALGADFKVLRFLKLSGGLASGGNYDKRLNIPLGITFVVGEHGTWEVGFASRDAVTYFRQKGPALSFAFGFLRFRA